MTDCHRCRADRQPPHFGSPRTCAFSAGTFSDDNWSCATMDVFRGWAYENQRNLRIGDTSIAVAPAFLGDEAWVPRGWIVMTYYKDRGKTSSACYIPTEGEPEPLTWRIAAEAAAVLEYDKEAA